MTAEHALRGCATVLLLAGASAAAQQPPQPLGTVRTADATITGGLAVQGERATLLTNVSVTALDHSAVIDLARGGQAMVCATSQFHLLHAGTGASLLFGLDRGAAEIRSFAEAQDVILTPDIRFTIEAPGTLDLRLRVTRDGDTCVENRGAHAPVLLLNGSFANTSYRLLPRQHVLFEHGDLHQVVDNEPSPCGCPESPPPPVALATLNPADRAAAEHPFPAAASQGLTSDPERAPSTATEGVRSTTEFRLNAGDTAPVALISNAPTAVAAPPSANPAPPPAAASPKAPRRHRKARKLPASPPAASDENVSAEPPPSPPGAHDIVHAIGHFFRGLFGHRQNQQ